MLTLMTFPLLAPTQKNFSTLFQCLKDSDFLVIINPSKCEFGVLIISPFLGYYVIAQEILDKVEGIKQFSQSNTPHKLKQFH